MVLNGGHSSVWSFIRGCTALCLFHNLFLLFEIIWDGSEVAGFLWKKWSACIHFLVSNVSCILQQQNWCVYWSVHFRTSGILSLQRGWGVITYLPFFKNYWEILWIKLEEQTNLMFVIQCFGLPVWAMCVCVCTVFVLVSVCACVCPCTINTVNGFQSVITVVHWEIKNITIGFTLQYKRIFINWYNEKLPFHTQKKDSYRIQHTKVHK